MTTLYYDVETTALPDFKLPAEAHENQPGVAQIAAVLMDDTWTVRGAINFILRQPDDVYVSADATKIHGIDRDKMERYGVAPKLAIRSFIELLNRADKLCAHNHKFDQKMLRIEMHRNGYAEFAEKLRAFPVDCTMALSNSIINIPPTEKMLAAGFTKNKPPKLEEAYYYFHDKEMLNAHDAWADVEATIAVHKAIIFGVSRDTQ